MGISSRRSKIGNGFTVFLLVILGMMMAFPFYYTLIQSIKPSEELFQFPPRLYVIRPTGEHYTELFQLMSNMWVPFSRYLFNTLFISIVGTLLHVFLAGMAAYPLAKHKFPGKDALFALILLGLMFVGQVTFLPTFIIIAKLNLLNTYWAYLLPSIGASLGLFLMKQFIEQLPNALLEAARIDGENEWGIYYKIVLPNIKPAALTVFIFQFVNICALCSTHGDSTLGHLRVRCKVTFVHCDNVGDLFFLKKPDQLAVGIVKSLRYVCDQHRAVCLVEHPARPRNTHFSQPSHVVDTRCVDYNDGTQRQKLHSLVHGVGSRSRNI